jgi:two-component system, NarL family, response regulator DesR
MSSAAYVAHRRSIGVPAPCHGRQRERLDLPGGLMVLVVDNDLAVRSSLQGTLTLEPGIGRVDTAPSSGAAIKRVIARRPDVCLIDYHVGEDVGLLLAHHLKQLDASPRVIVYMRSLDPTIAGAARVAGADGVIASTASEHELGQVIRRVAVGDKQLPIVPPTAMSALASRVDPEDRPMLTMLIHDTPPAEVAKVLGVSRAWLSTRRWAVLDTLRRAPRQTAVRASG